MWPVKKVKEAAIKKIGAQILTTPTGATDENIVKTVKRVGWFLPKEYKYISDYVVEKFEENHPSLLFVKKIMRECNPNFKEKLIKNFAINGLVLETKRRVKIEEEGIKVPYTILISPTMRCNLRCKGCYAYQYREDGNLSFDIFDKIINQGKELGVGLFTILGGEPLIYKGIFEIFRKHNDVMFQIYTNGTMLTEKNIKKLVEVGNVVPNLSLEGYEKKTDERREKGTFKKIMHAMDILRESGQPFGYSVTVTKDNLEIVSSDQFIDMLIDKGAFIGWYFLYMPIGECPTTEHMPTPEQRKYLLERGQHIRATRQIFLVDFWNDAPYVGGCISGREYIHINSKGDIEPCIFTHFAVDNIRDKSLKEALDSDFFKEISKKQRYNEEVLGNMLLPCMLIDHPQFLREIYEKTRPCPTHQGALSLLKELRPEIDKYAKELKEVYDPVWEEWCENERKEKEKQSVQEFV